ncbi:tetratricopeptide repeat protein [Cereibacter sphaeroides]|uniref:tetratricopeptide repeat protein n=1 Tax=Cereibacter sphaeroides TaxID=1063 RepID=UPI001F45ECFB|nr:tetratricopeptide repeat protein [Cereibacter sphaeroides]MCE6967579.1 tetratricopeptide repeat protein [Cereibacter sphaeroides]
MLKADAFIALSPLYDIQQGNEAGDTRWDGEGRLLDFQYNFIRAGECRKSQGYAFFCADGSNAIHAELIQRETGATLVPVPFGGHPCSFYLNDTYKLKPLVSEIASGSFDLDRFYAVLDQRTLDTHYPYERASVLQERSGNIAEATRQARIAVSKNDGLKRLQVRLGNLLLKEGDLDGAEMAFKRATRMRPVDPIAHIRLSYVYAARPNFDDAVAEMERAIIMDPLRAEYHVRLGEWLVRKGDLVAAERAMMRAIELKPDAVVAPVRLKAIRLKMGALSIGNRPHG